MKMSHPRDVVKDLETILSRTDIKVHRPGLIWDIGKVILEQQRFVDTPRALQVFDLYYNYPENPKTLVAIGKQFDRTDSWVTSTICKILRIYAHELAARDWRSKHPIER